MTFRATKLRPDETLTVNEPGAYALVTRLTAGTTWSGRGPRYLDVVWMGEHLALVKHRRDVEYEVVARADPKSYGDSTYRLAMKELAKESAENPYIPGGFALSHRVSKHGKLNTHRLASWCVKLRSADLHFERVRGELKAAAEAKAKADRRAEEEAAQARRLFLEAVRNALQAAGIPFQPTATSEISVTVNGVSLHVTDEGNARTSVISANQFAALAQALRDN